MLVLLPALGFSKDRMFKVFVETKLLSFFFFFFLKKAPNWYQQSNVKYECVYLNVCWEGGGVGRVG